MMGNELDRLLKNVSEKQTELAIFREGREYILIIPLRGYFYFWNERCFQLHLFFYLKRTVKLRNRDCKG